MGLFWWDFFDRTFLIGLLYWRLLVAPNSFPPEKPFCQTDTQPFFSGRIRRQVFAHSESWPKSDEAEADVPPVERPHRRWNRRSLPSSRSSKRRPSASSDVTPRDALSTSAVPGGGPWSELGPVCSRLPTLCGTHHWSSLRMLLLVEGWTKRPKFSIVSSMYTFHSNVSGLSPFKKQKCLSILSGSTNVAWMQCSYKEKTSSLEWITHTNVVKYCQAEPIQAACFFHKVILVDGACETGL